MALLRWQSPPAIQVIYCLCLSEFSSCSNAELSRPAIAGCWSLVASCLRCGIACTKRAHQCCRFWEIRMFAMCCPVCLHPTTAGQRQSVSESCVPECLSTCCFSAFAGQLRAAQPAAAVPAAAAAVRLGLYNCVRRAPPQDRGGGDGRGGKGGQHRQAAAAAGARAV